MMPSRPILSAVLLAGLSFAQTGRAADAPKPAGEACASGEPARHRARVPFADETLGSNEACVEPPDQEQILDKLDQADSRRARPERRNLRIQIEKIGQKTDPCKLYPLAGPCQLVHCHYKCTLSFDERSDSDFPVPFQSTVHRVEVLYLEKDYLRRCEPSDPAGTSTPEPDTEQRLSSLEQKLAGVVRELEELKASPPRDSVDSRAGANTSPSPLRREDSPSPTAESPGEHPGTTNYRGRVIGPDGAPVAGATVTPVQSDNETHPVSTDSDGRFAFTLPTSRGDRSEWHNAVRVEAPGLARRVFESTEMEKAAPTIRLQEGAPVSGRILYRGLPLNEVEIELVASDRSFPRFVGTWKAETDRHGRFQLKNIPKGAEYDLFFSRASLENFGAIAPRHLRIGPNALELDVADIEVGPAHRVGGRLIFADGRAIPDGVVAYADIREGWGSVRCPVDEQGRFEIRGLPTGAVTVWFLFDRRVYAPAGYRLSPRNRCFDPDRISLTGKLDRDVTDLLVLFEPGEREKLGDQPDEDDDDRRERLSRPLAGVESSARR